MATKGNTIGAGIVLDGEREFKQALADINSSLKVTASELTLVTAKFSDNAQSVSALTARHTALESHITEQTKKIEALRTALEHAKNTYGETDNKTLAWQTRLNKADAELYKMEGDLEKNSEALETARANMQKYGLAADEAAKQSGGLGSKLSGLAGTLGVNLPAGAEAAIKSLDNMNISTAALIGVTAGLIVGLGKLTIETSKAADEILTMSKITGISTDTLQEMQYASELVDVSVETMTGSMRKMIKSMSDAQGGNKGAIESFRGLHVSIYGANGQLKDSEEMFYQIIDALGKIPNETERDALAMQIFGKSAQELNPLIEAGSKSLKEFGEQAEAMGYVMDSKTLESLGRLDDSMRIFDNQAKAFKNSLAVVMLPALIALFEMLNKIDPKVLATVAIIGTIAIVAVTVVKAIGDITNTFGNMNPATLKTTAIVVGATAALIALAAIIAVIIGRGDDLNRTMASVGSSVNSMTNTVNGAGRSIGRNASGTSNWRGGLTWVGEEGPELIDLRSGAAVHNNRRSMEMVRNGELSASNGSTTQYITVNVQANDLQQMADVVQLFDGLKQRKRQGGVAFARS